MDRRSALGDAIKYLKHLQERVKKLEEESAKQTDRKSQILLEDESSSDEMSTSADEQSLPDIEAKFCDGKVLLKIQCEKHRGVLVKILSEVEKLNLLVTNTNVSPFGKTALDITIIAEMEGGFNKTMKELIEILRLAI